jgi:hypothetical protein
MMSFALPPPGFAGHDAEGQRTKSENPEVQSPGLALNMPRLRRLELP